MLGNDESCRSMQRPPKRTVKGIAKLYRDEIIDYFADPDNAKMIVEYGIAIAGNLIKEKNGVEPLS